MIGEVDPASQSRALEAKQDIIIRQQAVSLAAGVPIDSVTSSASAWDNGNVIDLGAAHSYKIVRVTVVEDTYIVVDDSTDDPDEGEFVPAGSALVFPCTGKRYVHHKGVTVAGAVGASAFAAIT